MFDSAVAKAEFSVLKATLLAVVGGWAFAGLLLASMCWTLSARGVSVDALPTTLAGLAAFPWFEAALRVWCVAWAAQRMARAGGEFPWSRATILGCLVGGCLVLEAWLLPGGTAARLPHVALWATLPAAWFGVILSCPLPAGSSVASPDEVRG